VAELNRVLFDAIEQALSGTVYDSIAQELFFGTQQTVVTCVDCNTSRSRGEPFLDLGLQVKNLPSVNASLDNLFQWEHFDGD